MKLNDTSFVGNDIFLKRAIKENLRDIQEELNAKNLFPKLKKEYNQLKATKKAMSKILDPGNEENNYMAVKTWFSSEESVAHFFTCTSILDILRGPFAGSDSHYIL